MHEGVFMIGNPKAGGDFTGGMCRMSSLKTLIAVDFCSS